VSRTECLLHHSEALTFAGSGAARADHMRAHLLCTHLQRGSHSAWAHHAQGPPPFAEKVNHSHTPFPDRNRLTHQLRSGKGELQQTSFCPVYLVQYARTQCIVSSGSLLLVQHSVGRPIVFVSLLSTPGRCECLISVGAQTLIILGACSCTPCNDAQLTRLPPMLCAHLWTKGRSRRAQTQPLT
jgi:hypothetical protein